MIAIEGFILSRKGPYYFSKGVTLMKNPILEQREKLSLTRRAFCVTYDVPISCQSGAELGHVTTTTALTYFAPPVLN